MNLPTTTFRFIYYFARQQRVKFSLIIFAFMVWATSEAVFPYFLKHVVNSIASFQGNRADIFSEIGVVLMLIAAFWIADEFFMRAEGIIQIFTFPKFRADIRHAVFNYVTSHSHDYFASNFAGNIAKKLADLPTSCQSIVEIICFQFITAFTGGVIVFVMMWLTQPIFAAILLAWLLVHLGITLFFLRRGDHLWEVHSEAVSVLSGKIVDVFSNMLNVRLFARRQYEAMYLGQFQDDEIIKAKKAMWMIEIMRLGLGINGVCLIFGMMFTLLYGWVHHWVTLGDFTQVMMQTVWLLGWLWYITFQLTIFVREKGTVGNALMLIRQSHDLTDKKNAQPIQVKHGEICFDRVSFAYQQNRAVRSSIFNQLNLTIPAGQKIGLVGYSGSGKSTFVNLILRFYDVQSGRILIDQQNIADITQDSLRAQIAMIPQEPALFHRTLMENIRYGRLDATDEEVIEASRQAHCHEFIVRLDDGYNALVGERGIKLSGGQRQRIAIARAILKNAPILILDEATSSLDSVTEKLIQESLHVLMHGRTTIVVAHRLSTLSNLDRIIVFDKGIIIEEGTKEHLLSLHGHFAKLWNMQTEGFLADRYQESGIRNQKRPVSFY